MCTSADLERWQPGVDSAPGMSWYALGPSASTSYGRLFVLPAQRPASPEIAESPSEMTIGGPDWLTGCVIGLTGVTCPLPGGVTIGSGSCLSPAIAVAGKAAASASIRTIHR